MSIIVTTASVHNLYMELTFSLRRRLRSRHHDVLADRLGSVQLVAHSALLLSPLALPSQMAQRRLRAQEEILKLFQLQRPLKKPFPTRFLRRCRTRKSNESTLSSNRDGNGEPTLCPMMGKLLFMV